MLNYFPKKFKTFNVLFTSGLAYRARYIEEEEFTPASRLVSFSVPPLLRGRS